MGFLEVQELTKRFGPTLAVDGLSFETEVGRITGFLGQNGAGKTTTLRMLLGLVRPTTGVAKVAGRPYAELSDPVRTVGAVLENSSFHPERSGRDHLRVLAAASRLPRTRADEVLGLVELTQAARRPAGEYSLGMRQRLALAAGLLGDPEGLVLDEPANGLDPHGIRWLRDFLRARADAGHAILLSSHVLAEVAQTVDDVVVLSRGRLVTKSPLDALQAQAATEISVVTPEADRLAKLLKARGGTLDRGRGGRLIVRDLSRESVGAVAGAEGIPIHEMAARSPTLEDVFMALTDGSESEPR